MHPHRLFRRTRSFRHAGFPCLAVIFLGLGVPAVDPRSGWQVLVGCLFCAAWPWAVDRLRARGPGGGSERFERLAYTAESLTVAAALGWTSLPPLPALATVVCLLAGATALSGLRLLLPSLAAVGLGAWAGAALAPTLTLASTPAADTLAALLIVGFSLALGNASYRQARRLDHQRRTLAERSAALERLNGRMERYLPPSLRERLAHAPEASCRWERRWLSVAFVDLVGFTEVSERLEAEPLAAILDDYLGGLIRAAEAHGGEVSKLLGDGVLVVFGIHEDAGRRQRAAAALGFCRGVPELLTDLARHWRARGELVSLHMRAGVASGYCTLGDRGGADRLDFTLVGTPVNLASRLQSHARQDGVLADAATAALAESTFRLEPPRVLRLKGLGDVPAFPVDGGPCVDPPPPSAIVAAPPALPGREAHGEPAERTASAAVGQGLSQGLPGRTDALHADLAEPPGRQVHAGVSPGQR